MKLIQLNIWGGKLQYQIPAFLKAEAPDIVCMQEVNDLPGPSGALFVALDELQAAVGLGHRFMSPVYSYNYMRRKIGYGNAMLSRLALDECDTVFTNGAYSEDFDLTSDDYNVRNLQHAVIAVNGKSVHVLNYHGFLVIGSKLGTEQTLAHARMIANYVAQLDGPIILTGDFNLSPASAAIRLLDDLLVNLPVLHGLRTTYSRFNVHEEVCDYVFVSKDISVESFRASDQLVSDHRALVLEFNV